MAVTIQKNKVITDDFTGEEGATHFEFTSPRDGKMFTIDVTDENREAIESDLAEVAQDQADTQAEVDRLLADLAGRVAERTDWFMDKSRPLRATRSTGPTAGSEAAAIREWAAANNFEVAERGRLSGEVIEAYRAAQEG